jgi:hypothetical protein
VRPNNPWTGSEAGAGTSESFYESPGNYSGGGPLDLAEIWGHAKEPEGRTLPMMLMPKVRELGNHVYIIKLTEGPHRDRSNLQPC